MSLHRIFSTFKKEPSIFHLIIWKKGPFFYYIFIKKSWFWSIFGPPKPYFLINFDQFLPRVEEIGHFGARGPKNPKNLWFLARNDKKCHFFAKTRPLKMDPPKKGVRMRQLDRKMASKTPIFDQKWPFFFKICRGGAGKWKKWQFWMRQLDRAKNAKTSKSL